MSNQHSYWETFSGYTGVSSIFGGKTVETPMTSSHFLDNNSVTGETKKTDRLWKLHPWISNLWESFLEASPEELHAVNVIMLHLKEKQFCISTCPKSLINRVLKHGVEVLCLDFYTILISAMIELTRKFQAI